MKAAAWAGSGAQGLLDAVKRVEAAIAKKPRLENTVLRVVSVDPGKVTGVALYWARRGSNGAWRVLAWAETLLAGPEQDQVFDVLDVCGAMVRHGSIDVVIESFTVRAVSMERTFLSPVRIGSKIEQGLIDKSVEWFHVVAVQWVSSSEMAAMRDDRLKALGHYTPGPDHRRDATRHALLHLRALSAGNKRRNTVADIIALRPPKWGSVHTGGTVYNGVRILSER